MKKTISNLKLLVYPVVLISFMGTGLVSSAAYAARKSAERPFPLGCRVRGFEFSGDTISFKPDYTGKKWEQTLYFLHNTSSQDVQLEMLKPHGQKFGPDYNNTIKAHSWGVFALDFRQFELTCREESFAGDVYTANCGDFFKICEYNNAKFAPHNRGTYWTVKSATRGQALRGAIKSGILLRS